MKSTILKNRALHVVAILVLLVGGLTFASCVSEKILKRAPSLARGFQIPLQPITLCSTSTISTS